MKLQVGDLVTRVKYQHDVVFKILTIKGEVAYLKGIDERLYADAPLEDLVFYEKIEDDRSEDDDILFDNLDRGDYFYLPGKVLHIDADEDYLKRCLKFYKKNKVMAVGKKIKESDVSSYIKNLLNEYQPDIVIITGHDAYYSRKGGKDDIKNYKNTENFVRAVKEARKFEKSHEKLVIIAGACQSNYEELIRAGANFASSPKRVYIISNGMMYVGFPR